MEAALLFGTTETVNDTFCQTGRLEAIGQRASCLDTFDKR